MKVTVMEQDIKQIIIDDSSASVIYIKHNKKDTQYEMEYRYSEAELDGGMDYCKHCGVMFNPEKHSECPICGGNQREIYDCNTVIDTVYSMLLDDCKISITLWNNETIDVKL